MSKFSITLRGYRPIQVDEYVARMQRIMARMESDLRRAREQSSTPAPAAHSRPTAPPRASSAATADLPEPGDEKFTERMEGILRAAEEEAAEIRQSARDSAQAAYTRARSEVSELVKQRDAVLSELTTMRRQIEEMFPTAAPPAPPRDQ